MSRGHPLIHAYTQIVIYPGKMARLEQQVARLAHDGAQTRDQGALATKHEEAQDADRALVT